MCTGNPAPATLCPCALPCSVCHSHSSPSSVAGAIPANAATPEPPDAEAPIPSESRTGGAASTVDLVAADSGILINELSNGGPNSDDDSFFELRNWSDAPVDLTGWHVFRCSWQGLRSNDGRPEAELGGITLAPGEIFTVSKIGMPGDAHLTQPSHPPASGCTSRTPPASW